MPFLIISLLFFMSACSSVSPRRSLGPADDIADQGGEASGAKIYRVGELEILVYRDREAMVKDLPDLPRFVEGLRFGNQQIKIYGYHDRENKRIYSVDDIPTLIHEFRHYLEPNWEHPAPQFTDVKTNDSAAAQSSLESMEAPTRQNAAPLPRLGCLPACLK